MNAYAVPPFLAAALNLGLIFWVYRETEPGMVRRTFILWNLGMCFWNASIAFGYLMTEREQALAWYHGTIPFAISFIAPFFLQFVASLTETPGRRIKIIIRGAYAWALVLSILGTLTPLLMKDVTPRFWGYYPVAGKGEWLFGISYLSVVIYALSLLAKAKAIATGHKRNQLKYLYVGALVCFGGGVTNILPLYGISIYPFGNLMNSIYSLVVAYAIVEYGLMNIQLVIRRGTVYALLSGSMTAVYVSLVAILQRLFGQYGVDQHMAFYTAAFPVTVVLAPAMKARLEPFVDQAFFHHSLENPRLDLTKKEMALFSVWASEMAHELTKPLTHIMNAGSQLGNVKGASRQNVKTIEKEVQRASEILDGFVMLSPERTLHRLAISLADLFEEAITSLGLNEDRTIRIVREYESLPAIFVNPGQIVQILTNLIQNAWQAMPDGGRLSLSLRGIRSSGKELEAVEILISDAGCGIAPEMQKKVFDPFFTTKIAAEGRGMGLTISRAMVERHGGTIAIESPISPKGGTRVAVRLPVNDLEVSHEK